MNHVVSRLGMWNAETKYILKTSENTNLTWIWLRTSSAHIRAGKNRKLITLTAVCLRRRCLLQRRMERGTLLSRCTQTKPHENWMLVSHCTLKKTQKSGMWVRHYTLNFTKTASVCHWTLTEPHENGTAECHCTRTKPHEPGSRSDIQKISSTFSKPNLHLYAHKNSHWPLSYIKRIHSCHHHVCALIPTFLPFTPMYPK